MKWTLPSCHDFSPRRPDCPYRSHATGSPTSKRSQRHEHTLQLSQTGHPMKGDRSFPNGQASCRLPFLFRRSPPKKTPRIRINGLNPTDSPPQAPPSFGASLKKLFSVAGQLKPPVLGGEFRVCRNRRVSPSWQRKFAGFGGRRPSGDLAMLVHASAIARYSQRLGCEIFLERRDLQTPACKTRGPRFPKWVVCCWLPQTKRALPPSPPNRCCGIVGRQCRQATPPGNSPGNREKNPESSQTI